MTREEFKVIYDQYFDLIRNYIYYRSGHTAVATDIAQEVFIKIWQKRMQYKATHIKGLLYKMAGDQFVTYARKEQVASQYIQEAKFSLQIDDDQDETYLEQKGKLDHALTLLSEKQRVVLLMNKIDGIKYKEVAQMLDISVKAVEKRMSQAMGKLKEAIQQ